MNTTLRLTAAIALAAPLATSTLASPPPAADAPPPDRGLLAGPDVGTRAAEGRRAFGAGEDRMQPGRRGQRGERGERAQGPGVRRFAMLAMAIRDAEPTPEQATAIRGDLAEVREKAEEFAKEHGEEMRRLVRVRRELVADGGDLREVDAEILALRTSFMKPGAILENVQARLDPEQRERFRESLERRVREAMERMRDRRRGEVQRGGEMPLEPRRRGGRPDGPGLRGPGADGSDASRGSEGMRRGGSRAVFGDSVEAIFESELLLEAMRSGVRGERGEGGRRRGDRPGGPDADRSRRGGTRPPLDLDAPPSDD